MKISFSNALHKEVLNKKIYIYGTGKKADKFYYWLKKNDCVSNIEAFVQTDIGDNSEKRHNGIPIIAPNKIINDDSIVCICVHESIVFEIYDELKKNNIVNYIFVTPILDQMILDGLDYHDDKIPIKDILVANLSVYFLVIRYLVITDYYNGTSDWDDIYKKCISLISKDVDTAASRLAYFKSLINEIDDKGYNENIPILLDKKMQIVNGAHRVSILLYKEMDYVPVRIINHENVISNEVYWKGRIREKELNEMNISNKQINIIKSTQKKIAERYGIVI